MCAGTAGAEGVRFAGATYLGDAPTAIAEAEGLFARHGLEAAVTQEADGVVALQRLRDGSADFALSAVTPIVLDRLADRSPGGPEDPVILASLVHSSQLLQLVWPATRGIRDPADLAGRRLAIRRGTNTEFVWAQLAAFHDIDPATVALVDRPFAEMGDALLAGEADAAILWEPWTSELERRFAQQTDNSLEHHDLSHVYDGKWLLVTTRRFAARHPGTCRAVLRAYRDAIERMERDPEGTQRTYARRSPADPELLKQHWSALEFDLNLDWSLIAALQQQLLWARRAGHGPADDTVAVLELIESAPLRSVDRGNVGIPARPGSGGGAP